MTVAKNNPYDLMGNDPDFLAAAVYADKKRFVLNGEAVEDQYWPVWTMLHKQLKKHPTKQQEDMETTRPGGYEGKIKEDI